MIIAPKSNVVVIPKEAIAEALSHLPPLPDK